VSRSLLFPLCFTSVESKRNGRKLTFDAFPFVLPLPFRNIYTRRVLAGEFQVVCPWLLRDLVLEGLWDDDMKNKIIAHGGSVQNIDEISDEIK